MPGFNIKVKDENICSYEQYKASDPSIDIGKPIVSRARTIPGYEGADHLGDYARKNRWLIEIHRPGEEKNFILYAFKCGRPAVEIEEAVVHHGQDEIYIPGKTKWSPIEFSFYEQLRAGNNIPDGPLPSGTGGFSRYNTAAKYFFTWWANDMINIQKSEYNTDKSKYLFNVDINLMNGLGEVHHYYRLQDSWPSKVTPSELDYSDSNITEISVTMRYSKAVEGYYNKDKFYGQEGKA